MKYNFGYNISFEFSPLGYNIQLKEIYTIWVPNKLSRRVIRYIREVVDDKKIKKWDELAKEYHLGERSWFSYTQLKDAITKTEEKVLLVIHPTESIIKIMKDQCNCKREFTFLYSDLVR